MKKLDLHGVSHQAAEDLIRTFLNFVILPCIITTGNSPKMKQVLRRVVKEYGWKTREPIYYNKGSFIVESESAA